MSKNKENTLVFPTWIMAITGIISLILGIVGTRSFDQEKFENYEKTIAYLKIPGQNPKLLNNIEFKLVELAFIERSITIDILITSQETSEKIFIKNETRLVDNFGNVYIPKIMKLGSKNHNWSVSDTLPADIGISAQFVFDNISSKATGIKLLEIHTKKGNVSFTDGDFIELSNELKSE